MSFTYDDGINLVTKYKAELPLPTDAAKDAYVAEFGAWLKGQAPEDRRLAAQILVDGAKNLITIGILFFGAMGGFLVQYISANHTILGIAPFFLGFAAILSVASMVFGFYAIGSAAPPWSPTPLDRPLWWQSMLGLVAIFSFAIAVMCWNTAQVGSGIAVKPVVNTSTIASGGTFILEGDWTKLTIRHGDVSVRLNPTTSGQTGTFAVELH